MNQILQAFGINWASLIAQIINFGILMFILQRFVYKPVLKMVDERRAAIAESMEKAKEIERGRELLEQQRADVLKKADTEGGALLNRAKEEAELMRAEIEKAAHAHAQQLVQKGMMQIETERAHVVKDIQTKLAHTIVLSAEKILRREFSAEDQNSFEEELKKSIPSLLS